MGILTAIKVFLRLILGPALYAGWMFTALRTLFNRVEWGLFLLVAMIPQPNVWYKLRDYPLGHSFIDVLVVSIFLGIIIQKKGFERTSNTPTIIIFIIVSYISLWNSSIRFALPLPLTLSNFLLSDWKNYAEMMLLYFLALNVVKEEDQHRKIVILMSVVVLLMAVRSYRNFDAGSTFDYDKRSGGPFEAVGLGANHFGAFMVDYCAVFLGLFLFDKDIKRRLLFLATFLFGLHPLFFSYSRGVYIATMGVLFFFGILKKRSLLILVAVIFFTWQTVLPASVVDRIKMTKNEQGELEDSAGGRILLWELAVKLFEEHPLFGVGYNGYSLSVGGVTLKEGDVLSNRQDVHNFYMRALSEQGVIGFILFLWLLVKSFISGWKLYKIGEVPFYKGLGFGFMGCVVAVALSNLFGDRWSYFALGGYFWVFWGLVDRALINRHATLLLEEERTSPIFVSKEIQI